MKTICTNPECQQTYHVKPEALGKLVRCKKCSEIFKIEFYDAPISTSDLLVDEEETTNNVVSNGSPEATLNSSSSKSTKEVIQQKINSIKLGFKKVIPMLLKSYEKKENESNTRLLIDLILKDVLGYRVDDDIKTEQKINGKKADYILSTKGQEVAIVEAKAVWMNLKESHIYQATTYGAYAGIKWVILTNGLVWRLYRISTGEKISHDLVFTIDLLDGLDEDEAEYMYLISKDGMSRRYLLEKCWKRIWALSSENLLIAILNEDVVSKIRTTLARQTGYKATNEELRQVLEENLLSLN